MKLYSRTALPYLSALGVTLACSSGGSGAPENTGLGATASISMTVAATTEVPSASNSVSVTPSAAGTPGPTTPSAMSAQSSSSATAAATGSLPPGSSSSTAGGASSAPSAAAPSASTSPTTSAPGSSTSGELPGDAGQDPPGPVTCDESEPPANVADWVEESWNSQLGDNIENRKAWLLDSVMKGGGQINLCVRWGATTAPSATVKAQLAASVEGWFNDWFRALGDYGCFPYADGIQAKLTGWAVKPGNEAWVSDLGSEVAVYTETDPDGEPKCPDACSFFENWDHEFPNCEGGEAFHTDYWLWVDDALPGGGGAAAVGGDWGLRMPVSSLVSSLGQSGNPIIEHEMGHGFGFQDYYDWTGSTPAGGSLMIVQSQAGGVPTVGDTWLLRRTWLESKRLRGW